MDDPVSGREDNNLNQTTVRRVSLEALAGLAIAILAILLFGWISEEMLENDTARFDDYVRTQVHSFSSPDFTATMKVASDLGSPVSVIVLTAIAIAVWWFRERRRQAVLVAVTMAGTGILEIVLKLCFHRMRPVPYFDLPIPASFSFPSGHAMGSFCYCGILAHLLTRDMRNKTERRAIWTGAVSVTLLVGFSRVYLGVHYPTDVIAGYTAGTVWLTAMILAHGELPHKPQLSLV